MSFCQSPRTPSAPPRGKLLGASISILRRIMTVWVTETVILHPRSRLQLLFSTAPRAHTERRVR